MLRQIRPIIIDKLLSLRVLIGRQLGHLLLDELDEVLIMNPPLHLIDHAIVSFFQFRRHLERNEVFAEIVILSSEIPDALGLVGRHLGQILQLDLRSIGMFEAEGISFVSIIMNLDEVVVQGLHSLRDLRSEELLELLDLSFRRSVFVYINRVNQEISPIFISLYQLSRSFLNIESLLEIENAILFRFGDDHVIIELLSLRPRLLLDLILDIRDALLKSIHPIFELLKKRLEKVLVLLELLLCLI